MIEELKSQDIINKVGGRFKLSALVQKRMLELMQGGRPLIEDTDGKTAMEIVIEEIKQRQDRHRYYARAAGTPSAADLRTTHGRQDRFHARSSRSAGCDGGVAAYKAVDLASKLTGAAQRSIAS